MSTVLLVENDGLYTDSKYVKQVNGQVIVNYENKIVKSKTGMFAYTSTGTYTVDNKDNIDQQIVKYLNEINNKLRTTINDTPSLSTGTIFVITKNNSFYIESTDDTTIINDAKGANYLTGGTGGQIARMVMRLKGDPELAIKGAILNDQTSGGPINKLTIDELLDYDVDKMKEYAELSADEFAKLNYNK